MLCPGGKPEASRGSGAACCAPTWAQRSISGTGGVRYATRAQLAMEDRMLAQARAEGAPRLDPRRRRAGCSARTPTRLEDALAGRAHRRAMTRALERTRLREDQAAAVLSVLTDGKRVSVINAPAGSGKTLVMY